MTRWWLGSLMVLGFLGIGFGADTEKSDAISPKEVVALFNDKDLTRLATWINAKKKGLSIVSGLCLHYDNGFRATVQRLHDGAVGDPPIVVPGVTKFV